MTGDPDSMNVIAKDDESVLPRLPATHPVRALWLDPQHGLIARIAAAIERCTPQLAPRTRRLHARTGRHHVRCCARWADRASPAGARRTRSAARHPGGPAGRVR